MMDFSSKLLENAVYEISQLPGIGKRTALRLALHLLKQPPTQTERLAASLVSLVNEITYCKQCHNISDTEICDICANIHRDVMAIENTGQYNGLYHVLGGKISPIDGVGPNELTIASLVKKVKEGSVKEIIFALSNTMEGDTTNFYIYRQLEGLDITTSTIARGIAVGGELEYTDEVTLGRSITQRIPFEKAIKAV